MFYFLVALLLVIGLYGVLAQRHIVKKILGLAIADYAVNIFLISVGYRQGKGPPILMPQDDPASFAAGSVDPLPQALVLTSIVIGLATTMLLVAVALRVYQRAGTMDANALDQLKG